MIDIRRFKEKTCGKPIAIMGLGRSGFSLYECCKKAGIDAVVWDENPEQQQKARDIGAPLEDLRTADISRFSFLCLAPGVPLTHPAPHPAVVKAKAAGVPVIGDMEVFHLAKADVKTIGITGTNGKSTTTALIGHILKEAGVPSAVGGNIGDAILTAPDLPPPAIYVLEMSSYQLDLCDTFSPDVAVLINLSPDHLDRHGDMNGYIRAKKRIFRKTGAAIIGVDDRDSRQVLSDVVNEGVRSVVPVSAFAQDKGIHVTDDGLLHDGNKFVADLKICPSLKGRHNWQNAAMATAAALAVGVAPEKIAAALKTFPGLAHRQNIVAVIRGVSYINDSKATNDQAAAQALRTYNPIYWIAGGKPKDGGYHDCEQHLSHVRHVFLIGQASDVLAAWLDKKGAPYTRCETLDKALAASHAMAQKEKLNDAVVLLSPACASFDQFKSFEHRGDVFVSLVQQLEQPRHDIRPQR